MITIKLVGSAWVACHNGDRNIIKLFGTDTLPTPYDHRTPGDTVLETIRRLNPGRQVNLA